LNIPRTQAPASRLDGKVAVVTGAASGIGRATAIMLAERGASLVVVDRQRQELEQVQRDITEGGGTALAVHADLSDRSAVEQIVPRTVAAYGHIDILASVAGVTRQIDVIDTDFDTWDLMIAVNLTAPFILLKAAAAEMITHGEGGRIVLVSSSSAFRSGAPAAYAASKAGILGLTRSAAGSLGKYDINVNTVVPGVTVTPMTEAAIGGREALESAVRDGRLANLLGRVSQPEDIAATIVFLCLPDSRQITAQSIHVSGGSVIT
jgi:NAD(P)-dependent dehydrogenase (short-subunit alcohol dehydrogenase family)